MDLYERNGNILYILNVLKKYSDEEHKLYATEIAEKVKEIYGVDIDSEDNLIATHHTPDEIARIIGADSLGFLPLESLREMSGCDKYCSACFDGDYPAGIPEDPAKDRFEKRLSEARK